MKTLDEVITGLDICKNFSYCTHPQKGECPYLYEDNSCGQDDLYRDALYYLKTIETTENLYHDAVNELSKWKDEDWKDRYLPLTWDELKQMEGKPVWVEQYNTDIKGWLLILRTNFDVITCTTRHGNSFHLYKSSYGERWQAYRKERT